MRRLLLQQAEVAELNRRAQHAEQESTAARAEAAAVRQAAAQQQAERAIAQYAQASRFTGLPFQEAQTAREYEPLPHLGLSRYERLQSCWFAIHSVCTALGQYINIYAGVCCCGSSLRSCVSWAPCVLKRKVECAAPITGDQF